MNLIISPWGDPTKWEIANYKLNDKKYSTSSSTSAIFDYLQDTKVLIICGLSLALKYPEILDNLDYDSLYNLDYDSISQKISCKIQNDLEKKNDDLIGKMLENAEIVIAPNKGQFFENVNGENRKLTISVEPEIFLSYTFFKILDFFKKYKDNSTINLFVDLTHGINYMTIITYEMSILASAVFSLLFDKTIKIKFLNSDPFQKYRDGSVPELKINEIRNIEFNRKSGFEQLISTLNTLPSNDSKDKDMTRKFQVIRISLENGWIHILDALSQDIKDLHSSFDKQHQKLVNKIDLKINGDTLTVKTDINYDLSYLLKYSLTKFVCDIIEPGKEWRSLDDIEKMAENYIQNKAAIQLIKNEVHNIIYKIKNCKADIKNKNEPFCLSLCFEDGGNVSTELNVRNLYAHGGFERNLTLLKISSNEDIDHINEDKIKSILMVKCQYDKDDLIKKIFKLFNKTI